ncbi:chaperone modulator CbpM [uncultured Cyclobacterium sp.]|uniref:chaperone modulator CbpM n=1 Tax=uncultured Cyclobacterium sp. TaxID=453820 RepID=UPI0030ED1210|tara:strand:+ start:43770 stop:44066 length:297 start_codon:yes stop_codon:yes gene_type:complete
MNNLSEDHVSLDQFCRSCNIEMTFVYSLAAQDMCEIIVIEEKEYVLQDDLRLLERLSRLHYEMEINLEGLYAIVHLQEKIERLKEEVKSLSRNLDRHQ